MENRHHQNGLVLTHLIYLEEEVRRDASGPVAAPVEAGPVPLTVAVGRAQDVVSVPTRVAPGAPCLR